MGLTTLNTVVRTSAASAGSTQEWGCSRGSERNKNRRRQIVVTPK